MYRPMPQHQPPWGVSTATASESHRVYGAADPYGTTPWPQAQQQQFGFQDPHAATSFHQHQNHHHVQRGLGRGQPGDELALRLKEEQRRKQAEYSQALAEQVRQREIQKQQEREARRREDAAEEATGMPGALDSRAPPRVERGLFDGLGQNNPSQRVNFGRGRREQPANQVTNQPGLSHSTSQQHFHDPRLPNGFPHHTVPQDGWEPQFAPSFPLHNQSQTWGAPPQHVPAGFTEHPGATTRQEGPRNQPPVQHEQPQAGGGRRIRTDLHGGNGAGMDETRRRQQQQQDIQDALRRQIEEKQRQKLEEKRKRDEEERREMEKFELEKRRQYEEQERQKEEKRRKALAEEQQLRAQQQQLEAATAAAAQEQRRQRQRNSPTKISPKNVPDPSTGDVLLPQPALMQKNPFTNSRAHLFKDSSPEAQTYQSDFPQTQQAVHNQNHQFNSPEPTFHHPATTVHSEPPFFHQRVQPQSVPRHSIDTRALMEQYEQVREELERQRRLVEQLHAQIQQQQQKQNDREVPRNLPTISDLERLRQELRGELEQREAQHRHELESLRRQQQQQLLQHQESPSRALPSAQRPAEPLPSSSHRVQSTRNPRNRGRGVFVQNALEEEGDDGELSEAEECSITSDARSSNQRLSPVASALQQGHVHRLRGSLSHSSLQCESKLVFFSPTHCETRNVKTVTETHPEETDERVDDSVDELARELTQSGSADIHWNPGRRSVGNQEDPLSQIQSPGKAMDGNNRDDGDSLEFFVRRFDRDRPDFELAEPARYRRSSLSSPMLQSGINDRVLAILDEVSDDEYDSGGASDDESLTGESLEAIFQRNLRRHEILTGFDNTVKAPGPMHWRELRSLLRDVEDAAQVRDATNTDANIQEARLLVASSRWLPSCLVENA